MKKILLILAMVLFAVQAWGATLIKFTDATDSSVTYYDTFADLNAGETLDDDDDVDLQGNTFKETLTPDGSGSDGHPITIHNGIIDGEDTRSTCIYINNRSYIIMDNITATGATTYGIGIQGNNLTIQNCTIYDNDKGMGGTTTLGDVYDVVINNNDIYNNGSASVDAGIWLNYGTSGNDAYNITITNNNIYGNWLGIKLNSVDQASHKLSGLVMTDNNIYNNSLSGSAIADTDNSVAVNTVLRNIVYGNGANPGGNNTNGLWFGYISYTTIADNVVYSNATGGIDGVGIFLDSNVGAGTGSHHNTIKNNITYGHDTQHGNDPWGVAQQFNSSGIGICCGSNDNLITGNVTYDNAVGISIAGDGADNLVYGNTAIRNRIGVWVNNDAGATGTILKNNIIAENTKTSIDETTVYDFATSTNSTVAVTEDYNSFGASPAYLPVDYTKGANSITTNPRITSTGKLYNNSPCKASKNPGTAVAGVNGTGTTDMWGNAGADLAIPIGAYFGPGDIHKTTLLNQHHPGVRIEANWGPGDIHKPGFLNPHYSGVRIGD